VHSYTSELWRVTKLRHGDGPEEKEEVVAALMELVLR
jgi:hypothetical protein